MALTLTTRITSESIEGHGTGPYTTAAFTPSDNSLLCVMVVAMDTQGASMTAADLTIADSLTSTWTSRAQTGAPPSWAYGARAWTTPITTGASMTVSIDCGAYEVRDYLIWVFDVTGYDTGTPVTGAVVGNDTDGVGVGSLTLAAAPTADDITVACTMVQSSLGITTGTGWTQAYTEGEANWHWSHFQHRTGSTSTTVQWDNLAASGSPTNAVMLAFNIKNSGGGGGDPNKNIPRLLLGVG